jgi:hypothetical protein
MGMAGCGNSVYMFGGFEGGIRKADLYRVSASSSLPAWQTVAASGTAPTARCVMVISNYTRLFMCVCVYIHVNQNKLRLRMYVYVYEYQYVSWPVFALNINMCLGLYLL